MKTDSRLTQSPDQSSRAPDSFEVSLKLAFEMHNKGRTADAEALCRVLLHVRPQDSQLLFLLGMVLHKAGMDDEAAKWLSLAGQYQPDSARIFSGLGCALQGLEDHVQAAAAFETAIRLAPQSPDAYYHLGLSCYWLEKIDRAASLFRHAVDLNPRDSKSWNNLGKCLKELNRLDESIEAYNRALEIEPDYALMRYGRAVSLLTAGHLAEGFKEYEWRFYSMPQREFFKPQWKGENTPGKTLLLYAEQGFGDAIQMVRFVHAARKRVGRVILECRPELQRLFDYCKCADLVIPYGAPIPAYDCAASLLSLPHALEIAAIPACGPYLMAPTQSKLPSPTGRLKVGLAWAGSPVHHQDASRSVPLGELATLLGVPGMAFYSLQKPISAGDESLLESLANLDSSLQFGDFLDTASVIGELDLVIAVDTAVAHLAGALGKPVWLLLQHSPDWRWLLDRADTPWYPKTRLFRQKERNQWDWPVKQVMEALRERGERTVSGQIACKGSN